MSFSGSRKKLAEPDLDPAWVRMTMNTFMEEIEALRRERADISEIRKHVRILRMDLPENTAALKIESVYLR